MKRFQSPISLGACSKHVPYLFLALCIKMLKIPVRIFIFIYLLSSCVLFVPFMFSQKYTDS